MSLLRPLNIWYILIGEKQNVLTLFGCFYRDGSKHMQGDHLGTLQDRLEKASIYYDLFENGRQKSVKNGEPTLEYEELRRRIGNGIQEMW